MSLDNLYRHFFPNFCFVERGKRGSTSSQTAYTEHHSEQNYTDVHKVLIEK